MKSANCNRVGIIGAGRLGQAMARSALRAGRSVVIAESRGLARGAGTCWARLRSRSCGGSSYVKPARGNLQPLTEPIETVRLPAALGGKPS